MTGVTYHKLFNTRIRHGFYESGNAIRDLAVRPTWQTRQVMKNGAMLFKHDNEGFRVFYKVDEAGNAFVPIDNSSLVFSLQLLNLNGFLNFTDLNDGSNLYAAGKIPYFTNRGTETEPGLTYVLLDKLKPSVFTYEFPVQATVGTGHLLIKNMAGVDVTPASPDPNAILPDAANRYVYPIDFTGMLPGLYTFQTRVNAEPLKTEYVYISDELAGMGAFGIVDIVLVSPDEFPPSPAERQYDLSFVARKSQWKYIVVLQSGSIADTESIGIKDEGGDQEPYHELLFGSSTPGTSNGLPAKIIKSARTDIPFFEVPKRRLAVVKNPGASYTKIATNIAGPSTGLVSAQSDNLGITEIFVYI